MLRNQQNPKSPIGFIIVDDHEAIISECPSCGWWRLVKALSTTAINDFDRLESGTHFIYEGIIHRFKSERSDRYIEAIRRRLAQRKVDLCSISPKNLEKLVGAIFRDHFGYDVRHVGGPGDGGVDLLVGETRDPIAIQVKRRVHDTASESVEEVRKLLGAMYIAGYRHAVLASTGRFSKPAQSLVSGLRKRRSVLIELYDHQKLLELIQSDSYCEHPWEAILDPARAPRSVVVRMLDRVLGRKHGSS